ncbi:MAG: hypothetical protein LBP28_01730 [Coriobacteriales bacterium]|jgi:prophage maintenance system killer protein|nr:hypothetical protein [Coriobacteriales bacterium]
MNGHRFKPRHNDLQAIILGVASGEKDYQDLVDFVRATVEAAAPADWSPPIR